MANSFLELDDAALAEIMSTSRIPRGEYGRIAVDFYKSGKKAIEIDIDPESATSVFAGSAANTVAQGFRNALNRAKIDESDVRVLTHTNGNGKPTVYIINVALTRQ